MTEALKPSEVLERAAALIEPEGAWLGGEGATGSYATDRSRLADLFGDSPRAVCWCARGAVQAAYGNHDHANEEAAIGYVARVIRRRSVADWNDAPERTQPEVVAALRKAAELAKAEGC